MERETRFGARRNGQIIIILPEKMKPLLVVFAFVVMEAHCLPRWLKFGSDDSAAAVAAAAAAERARMVKSGELSGCLPDCKFPRMCHCENVRKCADIFN